MTRFRLDDLPVKMRAQAKAQMMAGPELRAQAERLQLQKVLVEGAPPSGGFKYKNMPTVIDGIRFDSKKEGKRYVNLLLRQKAGEISRLRVHVRFALFDPGDNCRGEYMGRFTADFVYFENGAMVVEDVKSAATARARDWLRTKQLMRACHSIEVREIFRP